MNYLTPEWLTAAVGFLQFVVLAFQFYYLNRGIMLTQQAAEAAEKSAKAAVTAQRPWVGVDSVETTPLEVKKAFVIKAALRNSGHSPALQWRAFFNPTADIQETKYFELKTPGDSC